MRTRAEAVAKIHEQMSLNYDCSREKGPAFHFGHQELRELMDFMYEGHPNAPDELIVHREKREDDGTNT